jgi:hypothetical protein
VDCEYDPDIDGEKALLVGPPHAGVVLWNRATPHDEVIQVCVRITSNSATGTMTAAVHGVELALAGEGLSTFLAELAENFVGWEGVRTWHSLHHDVEINARHSSVGHVHLSWALRSRDILDDPWSASLTVDLEAGEEMRRLAADAHRVLAPPGK